MSKLGTRERSPKAEHRLKIRFAGPVFQLVDLRMSVAPGANYLFHLSNPHVKVDPKFVADHMEWVLAARYVTDVEDGQERMVAREAIVDLGDGDLAHFHPNGLRIFSSCLEKAHNRLAQTLDVYRIPEIPEKACFEIIKPEIGSTIPAGPLTSMKDESKPRRNYAFTTAQTFYYGRSRFSARWRKIVPESTSCVAIPALEKLRSSVISSTRLEPPTGSIFSQAMNTLESATAA